MNHRYRTNFFRLLRCVPIVVCVAISADARANSDRDLHDSLWTDLADSQLDRYSLFSAALIAGGVSDQQELSRHQERFSQVCNAGQSIVAGVDCQRQRATLLFQLVHRQCLTGQYEKGCWQLEKTLADGPYNCVTSTILYISLCRHFGIAIDAMAKPSHVYCRLAGNPPEDVQTTCAQWFSRTVAFRSAKVAEETFLSRSERRQQVETHRPDGTVPADGTEQSASSKLDRSESRKITDVQLIGKVYYNRATHLLQETNYRAAVECLELACQLDKQDMSANRNHLAAFNNWALDLADSGDFEEAVRVLHQGLSLASSDKLLLANERHIHRQWALELCQLGQYREAIELLEHCHQQRPDVELFDAGRWSVYRRWAEALFAQGEIQQVLNLFATAQSKYPNNRQIFDCETFFWKDCLALLHRENRLLEARQLRQQLDFLGLDLTSTDF